MFILQIEAGTTYEKNIRDTIILRIVRAAFFEAIVKNNQTAFLVSSEAEKEEIEKMMKVMNDVFVMNLICHFEWTDENLDQYVRLGFVRQ